MKILIHGYGLLSGNRLTTIAGSKMSGLTLYNSILFEGLRQRHEVAFLAGKIESVREIVDTKRLSSGNLVFEYDARFCDYLEEAGKFRHDLARKWYCEQVSDPNNPIFQCLIKVYLKVLDYFQPEVINLHNLNASSALVHVANSRKRPLPPILATIHDTNQEQLEFVARHQYYFDKFIAISRAVIDELTDVGIKSEKIEHIPNGLALEPFLNVDRSKWQRIAQRENLPSNNTFKVLVPARRVPEKGIEYAIKAFADFLKVTNRQSCLLISGAEMANPEYEIWLRNYINQLGCSHSVFFLGPITYDEMPALYAESDVSIIPSIVREGFCYSNVEAMATGGPVVVTTGQGGCLDYIAHQHNGILVPPRDSGAIVDALFHVFKYPDTANNIRGQAISTVRQYTAIAMVSTYTKLLGQFAQYAEVA